MSEMSVQQKQSLAGKCFWRVHLYPEVPTGNDFLAFVDARSGEVLFHLAGR